MDQIPTWAQIGALLFGFISVSTVLWGIWWRIDKVTGDRITAVKSDATTQSNAALAVATMAREELAEHKLHVAEKYVSIEAHSKTNQQVMEAIASVKTSVDGTNQRIDQWFQHSIRSARDE